jgi:hypothetical protein
MPHPIWHFEIPVDDLERAKKFYQGLFGWQIVDTGSEGYHLIQTGENVFAIWEENPQAQ